MLLSNYIAFTCSAFVAMSAVIGQVSQSLVRLLLAQTIKPQLARSVTPESVSCTLAAAKVATPSLPICAELHPGHTIVASRFL